MMCNYLIQSVKKLQECGTMILREKPFSLYTHNHTPHFTTTFIQVNLACLMKLLNLESTNNNLNFTLAIYVRYL